MLKPILNHILFSFLDKVENGRFVDQAYGQIIVPGHVQVHNNLESSKYARLGRVLAIGPDVIEDILPGMTIMIDNLKWSLSFEVDDIKIWRTDDSHVLAIVEKDD